MTKIKLKVVKMSAFPSGKKFFINLLCLLQIAALTSCITVNVNFPESAVQRAADDFVHDLYKETDPMQPPNNDKKPADDMKTTNKKKNKTSSLFKISTSLLWASLSVPMVFAAGELVEPPNKEAIMSTMRPRIAQLDPWKKSGAVCQSRDGKLDFVDPSKTQGKASEVKALVDAENADRERLFQAYEQVNNFKADKSKSRVREIFSESFLKHSPYPCK